jgi:hypothetical protein
MTGRASRASAVTRRAIALTDGVALVEGKPAGLRENAAEEYGLVVDLEPVSPGGIHEHRMADEGPGADEGEIVVDWTWHESRPRERVSIRSKAGGRRCQPTIAAVHPWSTASLRLAEYPVSSAAEEPVCRAAASRYGLRDCCLDCSS